MPIDARLLLRRLGPGVDPAPGRATLPREPLESLGFDRLLQLADETPPASGRPVDARDAELAGDPLDDAGLARLAAGADLAEASGAQRAVLLMGRRAFVLDVATRRLEREVGAGDAPVERVDAAVRVDRADRAERKARPTPPPSMLPPPAVAEQIERTRDEDHLLAG